MTGQWEPGTVAKVRVRGQEAVAFRQPAMWTTARPIPGVAHRLDHYDSDSQVTDVRPLVVLDLDDPATDASDLRALAKADRPANFDEAATLGLIAGQIEAQTRPAIAEPQGLGAVVEDADKVRWVRTDDGIVPWRRYPHGGFCGWSAFAAVRVLSEGVTS